jgi:transcriptional regulator with XRE-family HTH domain
MSHVNRYKVGELFPFPIEIDKDDPFVIETVNFNLNEEIIEMDYRCNFAMFLIEAIEYRRLDDRELSKRSGVRKKKLRKILSGDYKKLTPKVISKLLMALGMDMTFRFRVVEFDPIMDDDPENPIYTKDGKHELSEGYLYDHKDVDKCDDCTQENCDECEVFTVDEDKETDNNYIVGEFGMEYREGDSKNGDDDS